MDPTGPENNNKVKNNLSLLNQGQNMKYNRNYSELK